MWELIDSADRRLRCGALFLGATHVDEVVDHVKLDPTLHSIIAFVSAAVETVAPLGDADASLASGGHFWASRNQRFLCSRLRSGLSYFGQMRTKLIADAKSAGFQVVDMQPVFRAAYAVDHLTFEYPTDGHWNPHGHAVVAAAVREALGGWAPLDDGTR